MNRRQNNQPTDGRHLPKGVLASYLRDIVNYGNCGDMHSVKSLTNGNKYDDSGEPQPFTLNDRGYVILRELFKQGY